MALHEVRAWRPPVAGVHEVLHARFSEHGYPPHTHTTWAVLIVDAGAITYALDRRSHGTVGTDVTVLPPHVVHDGRPVSAAGFRKRVLYVDGTVLPESLAGRAVDRPTVDDLALRRAIASLHDALAPGGDVLDGDSRLALVADRLRGWLADRRPPPPDTGPPGPARRRLAGALRDLMDADVPGGLVLAEAAAVLGADPAVLVRAFSATFGITPHAYLVGRRLEIARDLLLGGVRPAAAATAAGFYDQAHLTRHFRKFLATTPGRFATS